MFTSIYIGLTVVIFIGFGIAAIYEWKESDEKPFGWAAFISIALAVVGISLM